MSFVHYLRKSGLEILTTGSSAADNQAGVAAARDYKTAGATLDTYTAITVAEMDCLDILRTWFGALSVPASTIEAIEKSIAQAADGLGKETMSIGWKDGEFFREAVNDDILHHQIQQLETIKSKIVDHCPTTYPRGRAIYANDGP